MTISSSLEIIWRSCQWRVRISVLLVHMEVKTDQGGRAPIRGEKFWFSQQAAPSNSYQLHWPRFSCTVEFTSASEEACVLRRNLTGLLVDNWTQRDECYMHYLYEGFRYQALSEPGWSGFPMRLLTENQVELSFDTKPVLFGNNYGHLVLYGLPHKNLCFVSTTLYYY